MLDLDLDAPIYEAIAERTKIQAAQADETISAVEADAERAEYLEVKTGVPLLVRERLVRDSGGRPMELAIIHYRADRFSYTISIRRVGQ
jgi:GntR family transcriptional regulator